MPCMHSAEAANAAEVATKAEGQKEREETQQWLDDLWRYEAEKAARGECFWCTGLGTEGQCDGCGQLVCWSCSNRSSVYTAATAVAVCHSCAMERGVSGGDLRALVESSPWPWYMRKSQEEPPPIRRPPSYPPIRPPPFYPEESAEVCAKRVVGELRYNARVYELAIMNDGWIAFDNLRALKGKNISDLEDILCLVNEGKKRVEHYYHYANGIANTVSLRVLWSPKTPWVTWDTPNCRFRYGQ